ncbi:hypothetical protein SAMN05444143_10597 [Flavobacterium succinicans]|uniref:Transmembrane protein n=1 Tax=Flavobacterium succinicans TaxID=29536 RepID=A0A1I4VPN0_9FLAO|nr:hypothetical protein SAMN05444143_10597 [Flavobacterium succinicans]
MILSTQLKIDIVGLLLSILFQIYHYFLQNQIQKSKEQYFSTLNHQYNYNSSLQNLSNCESLFTNY